MWISFGHSLSHPMVVGMTPVLSTSVTVRHPVPRRTPIAGVIFPVGRGKLCVSVGAGVLLGLGGWYFR